MKLRPYEPGDNWLVRGRPDFQAAYEAAGRVFPDGAKWTLLDGERVLAIAGITPLGDNWFGAWAYCSDMAPREWLRAGAIAAEFLRRFRTLQSGAQIQAMASDHPGSRALLQRIGFEATGLFEGQTIMHFREAA